MEENKWMVAVKGLVIGATMIVPGVSGGTMAIILGIYDRLISAVSSFHKSVRKNLLFLGLFALSAGAGLFLFSAPLSWLLEHYQVPTICFFIIVVICGIPVIGKKSGISHVNIQVVWYLILGAALVVTISRIPGDFFVLQSGEQKGAWLSLLIAGIASAVALILPGISFSHFLLILGLYDGLLKAIRTLDFGFLIPLGGGVLLGTFLLSRLLEKFMEKYPKQTYLIILGFIIGSIAELIVKYF